MQKKKSINADILDNYMLTDNITISEEIDRVICSKFKKMILKTGKPFSMVSNQDMKSVLRFLGSRQDLSIKCGMIAQKVKTKIKYLLITSSFISISVDEWSDFNKKRYLGVTAKCIQNGSISTYFLALKNIISMHINGEELNDTLNSILEDYGIDDRIMNAVSDNCNLMKNAFTYSSILRLPCTCHLLNLFLKAFIKPSEYIISEITAATRCLKSSVCYAALKYDYDDEPMVKNYNEIRWVSLFETFDSLQKSRSSIENFYLIEKTAGRDVKCKLYNRHWDFINLYLPILKTYKNAIEILESDQFGTISLVHGTFNKIKKMIMRLPSSFKDNIDSFKLEYDEKMAEFKDQINPIYDAATVLNPYVSNKGVNLNEAIKYIENKMKKLGWSRSKATESNDSTYKFFCDSDSDSNSEFASESDIDYQGPVQQIINMGKINPDINQKDPNDSLGEALFRFWKSKLDHNTDKILAQVAIGILNAFCTSCSAERLFSKAGRVLTRNRMRLMADVAESQVIIMANDQIADQYFDFD